MKTPQVPAPWSRHGAGKSTHPALVALRKIADESWILPSRVNRLIPEDHWEAVAAAIPALEALLAERDDLRAALENAIEWAEVQVGQGRDSIEAYWAPQARAALTKGAGS